MPEVTRTSAAVWMTQHRSCGRSIPLRSCRPGGVARCISNICRNLFLWKLSVILSIWGKKSLFSVKTSTNYLLSTCYANTDLLWGTWWYSPQLRWATFTGWRVITAVHCIPSNDSGVIPLFALIQLVLRCPFWPVQAHCHLLTQLHYQLFSLTF